MILSYCSSALQISLWITPSSGLIAWLISEQNVIHTVFWVSELLSEVPPAGQKRQPCHHVGAAVLSTPCLVGAPQVYKAEWNDFQQVAVKQLKQHDARSDIRFLREIAILKECRSTNVVQFLVRGNPLFDGMLLHRAYQASMQHSVTGPGPVCCALFELVPLTEFAISLLPGLNNLCVYSGYHHRYNLWLGVIICTDLRMAMC